MNDAKYTVTIQRGLVNFTVDRSELISSDETPDGITFKFKGGIIFSIEDQYMPSSIKQRVCVADVSFKKGNLLFNMNDYINPVTLTAL